MNDNNTLIICYNYTDFRYLCRKLNISPHAVRYLKFNGENLTSSIIGMRIEKIIVHTSPFEWVWDEIMMRCVPGCHCDL